MEITIAGKPIEKCTRQIFEGFGASELEGISVMDDVIDLNFLDGSTCKLGVLSAYSPYTPYQLYLGEIEDCADLILEEIEHFTEEGFELHIHHIYDRLSNSGRQQFASYRSEQINEALSRLCCAGEIESEICWETTYYRAVPYPVENFSCDGSTEHAKLSPSGASRWNCCIGSVNMKSTPPPKPMTFSYIINDIDQDAILKFFESNEPEENDYWSPDEDILSDISHMAYLAGPEGVTSIQLVDRLPEFAELSLMHRHFHLASLIERNELAVLASPDDISRFIDESYY